MKNLLYLWVLLFLLSWSSPEGDPNTQALELRIARIESGLTPSFQIKGQDPVTFNINERLDELKIPGLSRSVLFHRQTGSFLLG